MGSGKSWGVHGCHNRFLVCAMAMLIAFCALVGSAFAEDVSASDEAVGVSVPDVLVANEQELRDAIVAAGKHNSYLIRLTDDIVLSSRLEIDTVSPDLRIDLYGHDLKRTDAKDMWQGSVIWIARGSKVTIENTRFGKNAVISGGDAHYGGGIWNEGTAAITGVTIKGNSANYGGGVLNFGTMDLFDVRIVENDADNGGGICNESDGKNSAKLVATSTYIDSNSSSRGAVYCGLGSSTMHLGKCKIRKNTSTSGRTITIDEGGSAILSDCEITKNQSGEDRACIGGLGYYSVSGMMTVRDNYYCHSDGSSVPCDMDVRDPEHPIGVVGALSQYSRMGVTDFYGIYDVCLTITKDYAKYSDGIDPRNVFVPNEENRRVYLSHGEAKLHRGAYVRTYVDKDSHVMTCATCGEKVEEGPHVFGSGGRVCTVCGYDDAAWEQHQGLIDAARSGDTLKLTYDLHGYENMSPITIGAGTTVTIDLAGHTIDRGGSTDKQWGRAIVVEGNLTIIDSVGGGKVMGGFDGLTEATGDDLGSIGGGVFVANGATFTLASGSIESNGATNGGGVGIASGGTFNMEGGTIQSNTAARDGGGVYMSAGSTFNMSGGTIQNNSAEHAGGVSINSTGSSDGMGFRVSGSPVVSGNRELYSSRSPDIPLYSGDCIVVTGTLASGAEISVMPLFSGRSMVLTRGLEGNGDESAFRLSSGERMTGLKLGRNVAGELVAGDTVTVMFSPGTGKGSMANVYVIDGCAFELPACTFQGGDGTEFAGWSVGEGSQVVQAGERVNIFGNGAGQAVVTATWRRRGNATQFGEWEESTKGAEGTQTPESSTENSGKETSSLTREGQEMRSHGSAHDAEYEKLSSVAAPALRRLVPQFLSLGVRGYALAPSYVPSRVDESTNTTVPADTSNMSGTRTGSATGSPATTGVQSVTGTDVRSVSADSTVTTAPVASTTTVSVTTDAPAVQGAVVSRQLPETGDAGHGACVLPAMACGLATVLAGLARRCRANASRGHNDR